MYFLLWLKKTQFFLPLSLVLNNKVRLPQVVDCLIRHLLFPRHLNQCSSSAKPPLVNPQVVSRPLNLPHFSIYKASHSSKWLPAYLLEVTSPISQLAASSTPEALLLL